jgi:hypothetical protein
LLSPPPPPSLSLSLSESMKERVIERQTELVIEIVSDRNKEKE